MFPRLDLCLLCSVWACLRQIPHLFSLQVRPRTVLTPPLSPPWEHSQYLLETLLVFITGDTVSWSIMGI